MTDTYLNKVYDLPVAQIITAPLLHVRSQWICSPSGPKGKGADGSPVGDDFCSLPLVKVLGIHHPLFIANKLKRSFLETLLCQLSSTLLRRFAKAIRISASMVRANEPFHLLERPCKPFRGK